MTPRELIAEYLAAGRRGDWDTAYGYFSEDLVIHIPGRSSFAGTARGKQAAIDYIQTIRDHYMHGNIELELLDTLASEERVALLLVERFLGEGPPVEIRRANVYRVRDDRIVEISIFEGNQYAVDEMLAAIGR